MKPHSNQYAKESNKAIKYQTTFSIDCRLSEAKAEIVVGNTKHGSEAETKVAVDDTEHSIWHGEAKRQMESKHLTLFRLGRLGLRRLVRSRRT